MEFSNEVRTFAVALQVVALLLGIGVCIEGFAAHSAAIHPATVVQLSH